MSVILANDSMEYWSDKILHYNYIITVTSGVMITFLIDSRATVMSTVSKGKFFSVNYYDFRST